MSSARPPDRSTLDAMVLGSDDEQDLDAWKDLVASESASEAWAEAVTRRERMDAFAARIAGREWLASALHRVRRLCRCAASVDVEGIRGVWRPSLAGAYLDEARPRRTVELRWGDEQAVVAEPGDRFEFVLPPGTRLFFVTEGKAGKAGKGWEMEAGESPVLLLAIHADDTAFEDLDEALAQGRTVATLMLIAKEREKLG
jgi:hypothetical protein